MLSACRTSHVGIAMFGSLNSNFTAPELRSDFSQEEALPKQKQAAAEAWPVQTVTVENQ